MRRGSRSIKIHRQDIARLGPERTPATWHQTGSLTGAGRKHQCARDKTAPAQPRPYYRRGSKSAELAQPLAKRLECVELAPAFALPTRTRPSESAGVRRAQPSHKPERTPNASRGSNIAPKSSALTCRSCENLNKTAKLQPKKDFSCAFVRIPPQMSYPLCYDLTKNENYETQPTPQQREQGLPTIRNGNLRRGVDVDWKGKASPGHHAKSITRTNLRGIVTGLGFNVSDFHPR